MHSSIGLFIDAAILVFNWKNCGFDQLSEIQLADKTTFV